MLLTIGSLVLGLGLGLALRPRTTRFARPKVRAVEWLILGVVGQVVASFLTDSAALIVTLLALAILIAFALANLHLIGMGVITFGLCCNLLVIALNSGMPVRERSLVAADVVAASDITTLGLRGARHLERPGDRLTVLGDIIPMRGQVVSYGDLIIAVATVDVVMHLARRQRRRHASISIASPAHDWGTAPRAVPSSASQYSASPDAEAPRTLVSATSAPASHIK